MNRILHIDRNLINFGIPLGLLGILILLMKSSFPNGNDTVNFAITVDLLLTVPLVYFLLIRKSQIPKTTVVPVMIIGLLIGSYLLPKESQTYLELFKNWALPVIELSILIFVIVKVKKTIKTYQELKSKSPDFYDTMKSVCSEILPKKLVLPFSTEVSVIYYGFINWQKKSLQENEYTYHKKNGTIALFAALIMIIGVETIAFHFLLAKWNPVIAWMFTGLSIYTAIQMFGFAKSLSHRPISVNDNKLILKYGIMNEAKISLTDIDTIELSRKALDKDKLIKKLSPFGELESHNIIIHLKNEHELIGLYGIRKKFKIIGLHIDNPDDFKLKIENTLQQYI